MSEIISITIVDNDHEIDNPSFYSSIIKCVFGIIYSYFSGNELEPIKFKVYELTIKSDKNNNVSKIRFYAPPGLTINDFIEIYNHAKNIVKAVSKKIQNLNNIQ